MKLNNVRPRQVLMATVVILVAFYIIKMMKKPEDYERENGPSVETKITQQELDAIMKFIKR